MYLTKSAFMLGRTCPTKLYYHVQRYPNANAGDPYLELLAEGGFVVGKIAQMLHPEGVLVDTSNGVEAAYAQTQTLLEQPKVTIFEATFISKGKAASIDILRKDGERFEIFEVKSQSFDSEEDQRVKAEGKRGLIWNAKGTAIRAEWTDRIDDVAFQVLILEELFPNASLRASLLLPDKSKRVMMENLASQFGIVREAESKFAKVTIDFSGNVEELRQKHFLTAVPVDDETKLVLPVVREVSQRLCASLSPSIEKIPAALGKHCRDCEYRCGDAKSATETAPLGLEESRDGFRECWGSLADVEPHIFDLYFGGALKRKGAFLIDELIAEGKASLFDIPDEALTGIRGERQKLQIECTRSGKEWISPELKDFLGGVKFPLFFIDFETCRLAVPMHRGLRPFEQVAFQWSCHVVESLDQPPKHAEWINVEPRFPNFDFARSLMEQIGDDGTVFVWAQHEQTTLKDILDQMKRLEVKDASLEKWLDLMVNSPETQGRMVDMNRLALSYYFHPKMRGSTSLKYVLPAVWEASSEVRKLPWLAPYVKERDGKLLSPYEVLATTKIGDEEECVREGTAAMSAYQEMLFGEGARDAAVQASWRSLLLKYCQLDTLAMVVVFRHWLHG